ncbi:MAG TPA: shikimate dehydrogenase [Candidatus Acidoferrales bacterium]|nr:shikimate dehydrogenase [Candidatus Acidoferrales bacterium]
MLGHNKLCAVVASSTAQGMHRQLRQALRQTPTIELRLDWLADDHQINRFLAGLKAPRLGVTLIATLRRRQAGGHYQGTIAKQLLYLAEALGAGCQWYDLEIETVQRCPQELIDALLGGGRQLRSAHFFRRMPQNLGRIARELKRGDPDAIKIAAQCHSLGDAWRLQRLARRQRNLLAIPMGEAALPARILALRAKRGFSYAPVEQQTAPGQTSLEDLKRLYRADHMNSATEVYGVIGDPIAHSLSPLMHNAGFRRRRMNAVYLPFLIKDLEDFLGSIRRFGIRGFSVTLPHKRAILNHLDGCDRLAAEIGAVNTVVVRGSGTLYGSNTDYVGVLGTLARRMPLRGSRVLILGAGGAARAVAFALAKAGSAVCVWARRWKQATGLAKAVDGEAVARRRLCHEFFDAIVNATPVGMFPAVDRSPLEARELNCRLVFDTIYRPRATRLLHLASDRGIETVSGVEMFVAQGIAQWEIWTGERAPAEAMRRAVLAALEREERESR